MAIEMKETMLEVLLYLFENYLGADPIPTSEHAQLRDELEQAGFDEEEINGALNVLEGFSDLIQNLNNRPYQRKLPAIRVFTPQENHKLDILCRGFIIFLEQLEILDATTREWVIERAMALDMDEVDLQQLKWVILMVLFNQATPQINLAAVVNVAKEEITGRVH